MLFARTPEGDLLTLAIADELQRLAARDVDPYVRATASSIRQICKDCTFWELTWALTRNAALGNPHACLRIFGEIFDYMLENTLYTIAKKYSEIIPEGGIDALLAALEHAWGNVETKLQMGAANRTLSWLGGAEGAEAARAAAEKEKAKYAAAAADRITYWLIDSEVGIEPTTLSFQFCSMRVLSVNAHYTN